MPIPHLLSGVIDEQIRRTDVHSRKSYCKYLQVKAEWREPSLVFGVAPSFVHFLGLNLIYEPRHLHRDFVRARPVVANVFAKILQQNDEEEAKPHAH
jgi:hypothetical protein